MTASLQEKKGKFFIVVSYKENNKWKTKWVKTGLDVKGNKKKAKELLKEYLENNGGLNVNLTGLLFADFLKEWLKIIKPSIRENTYYQYKKVINNSIYPYFKELDISLRELTSMQLQKFYNDQLKTVSANTVLKRHANIHKALDYAVGAQLVQKNISDYVTLPRKGKFIGNFYSVDEIDSLFKIVEKTPIELPVKLAVYFGLRRSEILGLTWKSINFEKSMVEVKSTVVRAENGLVFDNKTKTDSSRRTLILDSSMRNYLKKVKKKQMENKFYYGDAYLNNDFICKWENGEPYKPDYISHKFSQIIKRQNKIPQYRFHDLRHSCASLLLSMDYSLKEIQEWLGHSTINTTANIYAHLNQEYKTNMAKALDQRLSV